MRTGDIQNRFVQGGVSFCAMRSVAPTALYVGMSNGVKPKCCLVGRASSR